MKKTLTLALLALAVAVVAGTVAAGPQASPATPSLTLKQATGQTGYSEAYCSRLLQRCENGEKNACTLYSQGCTD